MGSQSADIQLFLSNRLENLTGALIEQLANTDNHPLETDTIMVQSRGMARWLNLRMADQTGIQMNTRYPYPRALIEQLLLGVLNETEKSPLEMSSSEGLFWSIYACLPKWKNRPEASVLRQYLSSNNATTGYLRRYQLAVKIAEMVNNLQIFRPDVLDSWAKENKPQDWKSIVWRSLESSPESVSFPSLVGSFNRHVNALEKRPQSWPHQLHIIGISSLPPVYLDILAKASQLMPIKLYLTQPSPLYWGDQLTRKKQLKEIAPSSFSEGHPLLGNLGKQGQDFLNNLIDAEVFAAESTEYFTPPDGESLLCNLQKDLYELNPISQSKKPVENTETIQLHVCHTPKREIEVLKDSLYAQFETDKSLTPDQIIVMAPDIEKYASSIHSVFGGDNRGSNLLLPYSVADHSTLSSNPVAGALVSLLKLLESRFTINELLNFVSIPAISNRFELSEDDLGLLRIWFEDTSIRWGANASHREQTTGHSFDEFSWKQGIERLLAGYCIHPIEPSDWDSLNPYEHLEGSASLVLSRFLECWNFLEQHQGLATSTFKTSEWMMTLQNMVRFFFISPSTSTDEGEILLKHISTLIEDSAKSETDELMTFNVVRSIIEARLSKDFQAGGFYSGSITFCSLRPMRNIPAKVIALIGMDENAFPRQDFRTEFSILPGKQRIGDRSLREDDRYLFLESILSSRDLLYISYTGIDSQTLEQQPASIVVEELLDTLEQYYDFPDARSARKALVFQEPLQAFSPKNFLENQPRSYSTENLRAAKALIQNDLIPACFYTGPTKETETSTTQLQLTSLVGFLKNPSAYWLKSYLDIDYPYATRILDDTEPIEGGTLLQFKLGTQLLENRRNPSKKNQARIHDFLPVGDLQAVALQQAEEDAVEISSRYSELSSDTREPVSFSIDFGNFNLEGNLNEVSATNYLKLRFGKIRPVDILTTWVEHLCLCTQITNSAFTTSFLGRGEEVSFRHVSEAVEELTSLISWFQQGQQIPLPLFPKTSYSFAKAMLFPGRSRKSPQERAYTEFTKNPEGQFGPPGEAYNAAIQLCYPDPSKALGELFEQCALEVLGVAQKHIEGGPP